MKKQIFSFFCALGLALLAGCSSDNVEAVRKGFLVDSATPIGEAFERYPYFKSVSWKQETAPDGAAQVVVTGEYDMDKVRASTPAFPSEEQNALFARYLEEAAESAAAPLRARYMASFGRGEKPQGNIFRVDEARFVFESDNPLFAEAVATLAPQIADMGAQGLHEIYDGNTAAVLLLTGTIELTAKSLGQRRSAGGK